MIRRRATELREQAVDVRALADRLVAGSDAIGLTGRAAEDLRLRMRDRASQLRDVAVQHENAGEALARHGTAVGDVKDTIAGIERRAHSLVADARNRQAELAGFDDPAGVTRTLTPADQQLVDFDPPPPGHKDWLAVSLPGL
ncbi:MAG TPA: hypothetical protein VGE77_06815 [Nocardioides sp.]